MQRLAPLSPVHTTSDTQRQSDTIPFISMESWRFPATRATVSDSDRWRLDGACPAKRQFRILQLYANEERLSGATANRKEDGWAHVIVLLSAVDKHTQWGKIGSVSHSFLFVCTDLIHIYIIFSILPPKCLYVAARNLICCQGNQ